MQFALNETFMDFRLAAVKCGMRIEIPVTGQLEEFRKTNTTE